MEKNIGKIVRLNPYNHKKNDPFLGIDMKIIGIHKGSYMRHFKQIQPPRYICQVPDKGKLYCPVNNVIFAW